MINRVIIRIKVLQIVYAYYMKGSMMLENAENELVRSLQQVYDMYHYLFLLIAVLTDAEQKRLDLLKYKYLPSDEELNPNTRFINNRMAKQIQENRTLAKYSNACISMWNNDNPNFIRNLLNKITASDIYKDYLNSQDNYQSDKSFWLNVFKNILLEDEELQEVVSNSNIYIDDDMSLIGSFVIKTLKRFQPETDDNQELLPMFKDEEDRRYAIRLLHRAILEKEENEERINRQVKNWELERVAIIDLHIMQIALAELKNFPSIPVNVTLNEYIDLARYYSTPKSAHFINGILDAVVNEFKNEGLLFKN